MDTPRAWLATGQALAKVLLQAYAHGVAVSFLHMIHAYALAAGIQKRVYPHLFRHQIITFLTKKGLISPKLQLLSGHAEESSLALYRDLALADVTAEYEEAMQSFPVR
jgi:site-specific recombinase XerD